MIPKLLHYCWFGGKPLNKLGRECLESWRRFFPDYEIIEWNENNFDINSCKYAKQAYEAQKWAFVSDYARFKILYEYGGVYFDTDVEVIKSFDDILEKGNFMGCEKCSLVAPGLGLAFEPRAEIVREINEDYEKDEFLNPDGTCDLTTIVDRTTYVLKKYGLIESKNIQEIAGVKIYPPEYFCPIDMETNKLCITSNTHSIHKFASSWESKTSIVRGKIYRFVNRFFGKNAAMLLKNLFGKKH